jgi:nucleoside-triphosphatase
MAAKNILITGRPGVGKTTLIKTLTDRMSGFNRIGFYSQEVRENGLRKGFELVSLDGKKEILAHINVQSGYRVGKYQVNLKGFEWFLTEICFTDPDANMVVIDEIGKMECYSSRFRELIQRIMDSDRILVATIALRGDPFIESLKHRKDVRLYTLTRENRDSLISVLDNILRALAAEKMSR